MLILSRKLEEAIWLGDNIQIKIMGIEKGSVKIGIEAPSDVTILRQELKERWEQISPSFFLACKLGSMENSLGIRINFSDLLHLIEREKIKTLTLNYLSLTDCRRN